MIVLQKDDRDLVPRSFRPRIARADRASGAHVRAVWRHGGREMRLGQGYCQTYEVSNPVSVTSSGSSVGRTVGFGWGNVLMR